MRCGTVTFYAGATRIAAIAMAKADEQIIRLYLNHEKLPLKKASRAQLYSRRKKPRKGC